MVEKRNNRRYDVNLPMTFSGSVKGMGMVLNLSKGGCQMDSMADITNRDVLTLHLTLSLDEAPLTIDAASVRRCNERQFSVAFLIMDTKEQARLMIYLASLEKKAVNKASAM
jgi:hypothetical protein